MSSTGVFIEAPQNPRVFVYVLKGLRERWPVVKARLDELVEAAKGAGLVNFGTILEDPSARRYGHDWERIVRALECMPVKLVLTTNKALLADTEGEAHLRERAVEALGATMIYLRGAAPGFPRLQTSIQQPPGSEPSIDAGDNSPQGQT
jgi:hypothetical protein